MKRGGPLRGRSKDAYLRRLLGSEAGLHHEAVERVLARLRAEVAGIELREAGRRASKGDPAQNSTEPEPLDAGGAAESAPSDRDASSTPSEPLPSAAPFDPYSPNVIVVLRTKGREAALAALAGIGNADDLKVLAREQQLSIDADLRSADEIRLAIVEAADRRVANRRAAAR